jgi:hypothetical protein
MKKGLLIKILLSIVLVVLVVLLLFIIFSTKAPKIYFYDVDSIITQGDVFIDSEFYSEISEEGSVILPKSICESTHTITLMKGDKEYDFSFYQADCKYKRLNFTIGDIHKEIEKRPEDITMRFINSETQESLSGDLFIDGEFYSSIGGIITISRDFCSEIFFIMLEMSSETTASWENDPSLCYETDVLEFPIK